MKNTLKQAFESEMAAAYRSLQSGRLDQAFRHAEYAHVIGQRHVAPHVQTHWLMLKIGYKRHSATEVWGQAVRIVLGALGSAVGIVPIGNTGGSNVGMFQRMPIEPQIARMLDES
jgi:hypothetical protein